MSFNVVAAWPLAIVCASDRRLVNLISGNILTNRSTKMTIFGCSDAHGVIVYNGIGADDGGATTSDWLIDLQERMRLTALLATYLHRFRMIYRNGCNRFARNTAPRRSATVSYAARGWTVFPWSTESLIISTSSVMRKRPRCLRKSPSAVFRRRRKGRFGSSRVAFMRS